VLAHTSSLCLRTTACPHVPMRTRGHSSPASASGVSWPTVMKRVVSNMAGVVLEFLVKPGEEIAIDQDVVMLESMKMQIPVQSTVSGTVKTLKVNEGDFVDDGDVLLEVE
jgi:acetyl-CoA carboxylase biotin carboxyl carrier protein